MPRCSSVVVTLLIVRLVVNVCLTALFESGSRTRICADSSRGYSVKAGDRDLYGDSTVMCVTVLVTIVRTCHPSRSEK